MATYCCDHLRDVKKDLEAVLLDLALAADAADEELANAGSAYQAADNATQNQRRCRRIRNLLDEILAELPVR